MRFLPAILMLLATVFAVAPCASQQTPDQTQISAEEHSRRGVELYSAGKLPEAVGEMMKAFELVPEAGLLYNIARIYQKMGEDDLSIHYYKKFVTFEGADPDRVQKALVHLKDLKARGEAPPTAAPAPAPTPSDPPAPAEATPAEVTADTTPAQTPASPALTTTTSAASSSGDLVAWSFIGVGGSAIVVGAVLGTLAQGSADDLDDTTLFYDDKLDAQQSARDLALGADISLGLGLAAVGTGLILLLMSDENGAATVEIAPSLGVDHTSANVIVRFP